MERGKQRPTWRPRDRGQSPRAVQWAWPRSACTSRSFSSCLCSWCRVRGHGASRGVCRDAGIARVRAESLGVESSGPWVDDIGRAVDPRPLGTHVRRVLRLCGCSKRMVVRRTTRHGGAQTPSELDTCATDAGCAALGAKVHPHTPSTLVAHVVVIGGLAPSWRGCNQPTPQRNLVEARAEGHPCDWVVELGAWGTSIACKRRRNAILVYPSGEGNLPGQDCHLVGYVPSWAPRTTL